MNKPQIQVNQNAKQMLNTLKAAGNPKDILMSMATQNPQINAVMNMAKNAGGAKQLFYSEAQKRGIDPETILSQLR